MGKKIKALVTGGSGFLGQHLVRQLAETGKYDVTIFDIREGAYKSADVSTVVGDLRKPESVADACKGMQIVFHVATAAPTGANAINKDLMDGVNVRGTENVVAACVACGVPKLVLTSSASVVFDGHRLDMVTEACPYAAKPMDYYTQVAIQQVLGVENPCPPKPQNPQPF
jgi:sterol-4alpha-carboxylate 3-dehydrogenase (decarboxylating)